MVAELSVTFVELPFADGANVQDERLRLFSSLELTEAWLRDHLDDPWEYPEFAKEARVLWFTVLVGELDGPWEPECIRYDSRGNIFEDGRTSTDPWPGRPPETCAFAPGDSVLCVRYRGRSPERYLARGVVKHRPPPRRVHTARTER